jgi:thiosulfate/3-mercaptopyruvate sulfurtransferase
MRKIKFVFAVIAVMLFLPFVVFAANMEPLVTPDWLEKNLSAPNTIIVDIRKVEEYRDGHVPNAINVFINSWAIKRGDLLNELPADDDLRDLLGAAGITKDSAVVVVGKNDPMVDRLSMTRVAWTLTYAGVENVAVLNGGYDRWVAEKKEVSKTAAQGKKTTYDVPFNKSVFADKAYVTSRIGKATIIDVREPPFYKGEKKVDFVAKAGRIKGAVNLPNSSMYTKEGYFKSRDELAALAAPVVGADKDKEIILYCDTGKTCTPWWLVLRDLLGYKDVKNYDGSAMDWMKDPAGPIEP